VYICYQPRHPVVLVECLNLSAKWLWNWPGNLMWHMVPLYGQYFADVIGLYYIT